MERYNEPSAEWLKGKRQACGRYQEPPVSWTVWAAAIGGLVLFLAGGVGIWGFGAVSLVRLLTK